jgi:hypothetical protein
VSYQVNWEITGVAARACPASCATPTRRRSRSNGTLLPRTVVLSETMSNALRRSQTQRQ